MHGSIEVRDATEIGVVADDMPRDDGAQSVRDMRNAPLSFFCPDVTDASTLKRVQQFMDFGYSVTVFGFRRERYNTDYQPPWPNVPLGFTTDLKNVFAGADTRLLAVTGGLVLFLLILIYRSPIFLFIPLASVIFAEFLSQIGRAHV